MRVDDGFRGKVVYLIEIFGFFVMIWLVCFVRFCVVDYVCYGLGKREVNIGKFFCYVVVDNCFVVMVKFEVKSSQDMGFFDFGKGVVKQLSLRVVFIEFCVFCLFFDVLDFGWVVDIFVFFFCSWWVCFKVIWLVVDFVVSDCVMYCIVLVEVYDGVNRFVDRQFLLVYVEMGDLSIEI